MTVKAVAYSYLERGGTIDVEDDDLGRCVITESNTATLNQLRIRAAKKLRHMADRLEADAKHKMRPDGHVETFLPQPMNPRGNDG